MVEWLMHHDTTTSHVRQLGGIIISLLVRSMFINIVYHAGYTSELMKVHKAFEINPEDAFSTKPIFALSYAWKISESFRSWVSREKQLHGLAYETLTQKYFKRLHFLLSVNSIERERYGDDKKKFSEALMKVYKEEKVNPLGGCLPILISHHLIYLIYHNLNPLLSYER